MILDTHQHFWKVARGDYYWMTPEIPKVLFRDYLPEDLAPLLGKAGISKTIVVQAAETEAETDFLLDLAEKNDFIAGVTGWLDMESANFSKRLEHYRKNPYFVALRPMIQDNPDDHWILKPQVLENLQLINEADFPFEILIYPRQLPAVIDAVKKIPDLRAVVNHIGKPTIRDKIMEPWAKQMAHLGQYPNISCKLSGMITEAAHESWSLEDLRPYVEHILKVFGSDRVMYGSDWPVALLAGSYDEVINALRTILVPLLDSTEQHKVFYANGMVFYKLRE